MPLQGNLKEMSLANLIQVNCQEMRSARLTLERGEQEGEVYFSDGQVAHAIMGNLAGAPAVYEMLAWSDGTFILDRDQPTPTKTIAVPWNALLLEGMKRLAERPVKSKKNGNGALKSDALAPLKSIDGVGGVVVSSCDGVVLAADVPGGDGESDAAVSVFISAAAAQLGEALQLNTFSHGVASLKNKRLLVMQKSDHCIGIVLSENSSPTIVANAVNQAITSKG